MFDGLVLSGLGLISPIAYFFQRPPASFPQDTKTDGPTSKPLSILEAAEFNIHKAAEAMGLDRVLLSRILKPKRITEVKFTIKMDDGSIKTFWGFRALQNDARGAGKGGLRWLINEGGTLEEAKKTAVGLAVLMTIKTGVIGIPYGGGKGDIVVEKGRDYSDREKALIVRGFSSELTKRKAVGTFIDSPAPDMGTDETMMAWFMDEHLRVLAQKGSLHDKAIQKILERIIPGDDPTKTPFLNEYIRVVSEDGEGVLQSGT